MAFYSKRFLCILCSIICLLFSANAIAENSSSKGVAHASIKLIDNLEFGMSYDKAKMISQYGQETWSRDSWFYVFKDKALNNHNTNQLLASYDKKISGYPCKVHVFFDDNDKLIQVMYELYEKEAVIYPLTDEDIESIQSILNEDPDTVFVDTEFNFTEKTFTQFEQKDFTPEEATEHFHKIEELLTSTYGIGRNQSESRRYTYGIPPIQIIALEKFLDDHHVETIELKDYSQRIIVQPDGSCVEIDNCIINFKLQEYNNRYKDSYVHYVLYSYYDYDISDISQGSGEASF